MWSFSSLYGGGLRTALALLRVVGVCLSVCHSTITQDSFRLIGLRVAVIVLTM